MSWWNIVRCADAGAGGRSGASGAEQGVILAGARSLLLSMPPLNSPRGVSDAKRGVGIGEFSLMGGSGPRVAQKGPGRVSNSQSGWPQFIPEGLGRELLREGAGVNQPHDVCSVFGIQTFQSQVTFD